MTTNVDAVVVRLAQGTQELEMREVMREDDVAQLVHDLKNPLATIALEAGLIDELIVHGERGAAIRVAGRIRNNVMFLDRMIQDLMDMCALAVGQFQLRRAPTELRTLVESVIERIVPSRDFHRVFLEAPRPVAVCIDDLRIERVIANLIDNALKYAPASSGVIVKVHVEADKACVAVIDAGGGVTPADLSMLFEKYRRGGSAGGNGSGLGLYVSKRIIEAHGGRIGAENIRGAGSRFFFELPLS